MENLAFDLADILDTVQAHGTYYASATQQATAPMLEVAGFGRVALPLMPDQAASLIAQADPAPFGRGAQTIIDETVRKSWQIAAERVQLSGRNWPATLDAIINQASAALGVQGPVAAQRYKLLIDGPGCFFTPHRDTEKSDGMFATLVIVLPSLCQGGELVIRHEDAEVCLDLNRSEPDELAYAAFYADCLHEMRPVTAGHRLTLIYNLLRYGDGPVPELMPQGGQVAALTALLQRWGQASALDAAPTKLLYPLEHAYTPAELDFSRLKPADAAVAATLHTAAREADCEVHVALLSIEESGSAEYNVSRHRSRRHRYWHDDDENDGEEGYAGDDDFEIGEIIDSNCTLSYWRRPDGDPSAINTLPFTRDELCPPDLFDDMEPDEQHFYGSTGNDGASFERSYQRAVLVVWPRAQQLAVHNQGGLAATLPLLQQALQSWLADTSGQRPALWQVAHRLAELMQGSWQKSHRYPNPEHASHATQFLHCLVQLQDQSVIGAFLHQITAAGILHGDENPALVQALAVLDADAAQAALEKIISSTGRKNALACSNVLLQVASEPSLRQRSRAWHPAARTLVGQILDQTPGSFDNGWQYPVKIGADLIVDLLDALAQLCAPDLAHRLLDALLETSPRHDMDRVLLPAALQLLRRACHADPCVARLREACLTHLRQRIALPLAAPLDFARPANLSCTCVDCKRLARFLADPVQARWTLTAAESRRRHVEATAQRDQCDLDFSTLTQGRPYTLVANKNQASYQRRVGQRQSDLADLAQLTK